LRYLAFLHESGPIPWADQTFAMNEPIDCPLCERVGLVAETAQYLRCSECGTLTQVVGRADTSSDLVDYARGPNASDHRWISLLSGLTEGRRLLDVGCGSGAFIEAAPITCATAGACRGSWVQGRNMLRPYTSCSAGCSREASRASAAEVVGSTLLWGVRFTAIDAINDQTAVVPCQRLAEGRGSWS
jgi:hypothetical protein